MKEKLKGFVLGIVVTALLLCSVNVFAADFVKQTIQVTYSNIKLLVDGKPVVFGKDSKGNQIEPFIYNGTTYLPVRAVGEALGKKVDWDGATQTVYVGQKPGEVNYMTEAVEPYKVYNTTVYTLSSPDKFSMAGKNYKTGYVFGGYIDSYVLFNLDGQYEEISGAIGAVSWKFTTKRNIAIYLDGELYKDIVVDPLGMPEEITIPVKGVMQVRLESDYSSAGGTNGDTYVAFADVLIK